MFSINSNPAKKDMIPNAGKTKEDFKNNKLSGLFQAFDPKTGKLKEEGKFQYGQEAGIWKEYDADGDQIHYQYVTERVGALCKDGSTSSATGRGACSWHGGVAQWLYQTFKRKIGGTGKYVPIETRVQALKQKMKAKLKSNKSGLEFEEQLLKTMLTLFDSNESMKQQLAAKTKKLEQKQKELDSTKMRMYSMSETIASLKRAQKERKIQKSPTKEKQSSENQKPQKALIDSDSEEEQNQKASQTQKKKGKSTEDKSLNTLRANNAKQTEKEKPSFDEKEGSEKQNIKKQEEPAQHEINEGLSDDWESEEEVKQEDRKQEEGNGEKDKNESELIKQLLAKLKIT